MFFYCNFGASSFGAFWYFVYYRMFIGSLRFLLVIFIIFRLLIATFVLTLVTGKINQFSTQWFKWFFCGFCVVYTKYPFLEKLPFFQVWFNPVPYMVMQFSKGGKMFSLTWGKIWRIWLPYLVKENPQMEFEFSNSGKCSHWNSKPSLVYQYPKWNANRSRMENCL